MNPERASGDLGSRYFRTLEHLAVRRQEHLLRWWPELSTAARAHLLSELEALPWTDLDALIQSHVLGKPQESVLADPQPAPVIPRAALAADQARHSTIAACGQELLRRGKVAAFTVAGGQGTRLGVDGPKGAVAVSPIRHKTLFQLFAEMVATARRKYGAAIRWYIMTSPANHEQTERFFCEHGHFGLPQEDVILFRQGMLPSFDLEGRILLADKHRLALAPDGHGGALKALVASGALGDMRSRGIEIISYFQVDNPLIRPFDPIFIGLHAQSGSEMSTKVTPKADDFERVGNICLQNGRLVVIEYSDLPKELAIARNPDCSRRFNVGNLAIHLLQVAFVERVVAQRFSLPHHRAQKAVAYVDETGMLRTPAAPNAVKLETFVFDALPLGSNPLLLEIDRAEEFSPVKNAHGADSIETAIRDQVRRAARWLEAAGVAMPRRPDGEPDVVLEIAPAYALDPEDIHQRLTRPLTLRRGESHYLS